MAFPTKPWVDRPSELDPLPGESPAEWLARIVAYDAANPGALTPVDAAALIDGEVRLSDYTDAEVAALAASVTSALALKAALASPTFTGAPTAPTASPLDSSTTLATTEYVDDAVTAGGGGGGGGVTPLSWTTITLGSGWNATGGFLVPAWAKDDYGIVHLRGVLDKFAPSPGNTISTLAVGARPAAEVRLTGHLIDSNGNSWGCSFAVWANGTFQLVDVFGAAVLSTSCEFHIDGLSYPTV